MIEVRHGQGPNDVLAIVDVLVQLVVQFRIGLEDGLQQAGIEDVSIGAVGCMMIVAAAFGHFL